MNDERFIRLVEQVEEVGGELLTETHWPTAVTYEMSGPSGKKSHQVELTGCGHEALLQVPYDVFEVDKAGNETGQPEPGNYKACAVCDLVALQPRFAI